MIRYLFVISVFCILTSSLAAQNPTIDSLKMAIDQAGTLPEKVDTYNYLAAEYSDIDPRESIRISTQARALAEQAGYQEGIFYAYANLGTAYDDLGMGDSSYYYFEKAEALAIDMEDHYALSIVKNNFGLYYLFRGNYPIALKYFQESLETVNEPGYYMDPVITLNNIGVIHEEQGNLEKAIDYYQQAGEVSMKNGNEAFAYLCFGYIYQLKEEFGRAISFYQDALEVYRAKEDEPLIAETLYYLGECYLGKREFETSRNLLWQSMAFYDRLGRISDVVEIYYTIAEGYEAEGNHVEALQLFYQSKELAGKSELNSQLVPIYKALARMYALKKDFGTAYQYQLQYQDLNDTIYSNKTKERIAQLESSYELMVNKAHRERLEAEQLRKEAVVKQRTILAVLSTIAALLLAWMVGIYYLANRQKKILNKSLENKVRERTAELEQVNKHLMESNEDLERFSYIASHDLKEPLRNITSFINLIQRKLKNHEDADLKEYMQFVTRNARQMYELIEDILNFSRVAALNVRETGWLDLNKIMAEVEASLITLITERNGRLEILPLPEIPAHKAHIFMLFKNLIENGLKYNESEQPEIRISCREEENFFCFSVKDNGIGIEPHYHEQAFEIFKRITTRDQYDGTGIGLAISKKIVNNYGGSIWVESRPGQGSTFFFTWPRPN